MIVMMTMPKAMIMMTMTEYSMIDSMLGGTSSFRKIDSARKEESITELVSYLPNDFFPI